MAVEARHLNLFPLRHLANREMMNTIQAWNTNIYNANATTTAHMGYGMLPLSGTTTAMTEALHHPSVAASPAAMYSSVITDSIPPHNKAPIKSESELTYNYLPAPAVTRKRPRENSIINPILSSLPSSYPAPQTNKTCTSPATVAVAAAAPLSFLGLDLTLQIQQEQLDIDRLVSQHMDKVRMEIEEKRKRQARRIIEGLEERMMKRLRAKEEEIERIGKLNWALEEKVKSLCIENQMWRDLAQTNEATANALRTNLEQVLAAAAQVKDERTRFDEATALTDDAQSCCGSTDGGGVGGGGAAGGLEEEEWCSLAAGNTNGWFAPDQRSSSNGGNRRLCRNCRKEEASVLLLPCRHLCLCTNCGSSLHTCPICKANKNASVHVNMS